MNHRYLEIFENASDAVLVSDDSQRIVFWNKKAEQLLGYKAQEVIGKLIHKIVSGCTVGAAPAQAVSQQPSDAAEGAPSSLPVEATKTLVQSVDGHEKLINVEHTFLYPRNAENNGSFLVMHFLREARNQDGAHQGLHIQLLGQTKVSLSHGQRLDGALWHRTMVRALMALLVIHRRDGIRRDMLLDLLWREKEREAALANLNTTVYYLRRALQPDLNKGERSRYIQIEGELYRLADPADHWVDVQVFEDTLARAERASGRPEAIARYEEALAVYQGDFLADLDFPDGRFLSKREYLRKRYLTALRKLAALYEDQGKDGRAEALYLKILGHDQLQEDVCRHAMRLMLRRDSRADAIACFRRLKEHLETDLNVTPEPATLALFQQAKEPTPLVQSNGKRTYQTRHVFGTSPLSAELAGASVD